MNIFLHLHSEISRRIGAIVADNLPFAVELPKDSSHGDFSTNVAMIAAPRLKTNPRDLAQKISLLLTDINHVDKVEIAGPGFINFRMKPTFWGDFIKSVLSEGLAYGRDNLGKGKKINVEYVSANPTGPMHIGHARGAVVGDALAAILEASGYNVTREYYINDAGGQVEVLAASVFERYREALGENIGEIPEGLYPGEYLKPVALKLAEEFGSKLKTMDKVEAFEIIKSHALSAMMDLIRDDLTSLSVKHDVFFSEKQLHQSGRINEALQKLEAAGYIYEGVLEPPKGMKPDDWEARPQTLFRSTEFGDDIDRPLKKSDGSYTYFAADIAYHYDKFTRGFNQQIDVWGVDHGGYVKRMKAALQAISNKEAKLDVLLTQLVNLTDGGKPVKMSKRAGTFVTLREVVDEVGADAVRFIMLTRKSDASLDFDLAKVKEKSSDNPVFYVQYAHARANSVFRNAAEICPQAVEAAQNYAFVDMSVINHPKEQAILKSIAMWPKVMAAATENLEPHRIAFYLQDLAAEFHGFWNLGKEDVDLRMIIVENPSLTAARLVLLKTVQTVIASGLKVLGVEPANEMK